MGSAPGLACARCGRPLPPPSPGGHRPREYCSRRCAARARASRAFVAELAARARAKLKRAQEADERDEAHEETLAPRSTFADFLDGVPPDLIEAMRTEEEERTPHQRGLVKGWLAGVIEKGLRRPGT